MDEETGTQFEGLLSLCRELIEIHDLNKWNDATEGGELGEVIDRIRCVIEKEKER